MPTTSRRLLAVTAVLLLIFVGATAGCAKKSAEVELGEKSASVVKVPGTDKVQVQLTEEAAKRLDIKTEPVSDKSVPARPSTLVPTAAGPAAAPTAAAETDAVKGTVKAATTPTTATPPLAAAVPAASVRRVVPYSAVLYLASGEAYLYANPSPLTYERQAVTVDYVINDLAVISAGPALGTAVVVVGAPELSGVEFGVGE